MSDKPFIFISHSSKDREIANLLKTEIEDLFDNKIEVWHSSRDDSISAGDDWLETIRKNLDKANALLVLVSRYAKASEWVHWEIGYFEKNQRNTQKILPVYVATIANEAIFNVLAYKRTQSKSLNNVKSISDLLISISKKFNLSFVREKLVNSAEIIAKNTYTLPILDEDYQILSDYLHYEYSTEIGTNQDWITYRSLDGQKRLPNGTSKELLKQLVIDDPELQWEVKEESNQGISFVHSRGHTTYTIDTF